MNAPRKAHRRASGALRRLSSGRWQARYTSQDGLQRTLGTFDTKAEADLALADENSRMAHGQWHDPRLGEVPLGEWFREWLATRGEIAESTRAIYQGLLDRWIDAPLTIERPNRRPRVIHLGAQSLGSVTPGRSRHIQGAAETQVGLRPAASGRPAEPATAPVPGQPDE